MWEFLRLHNCETDVIDSWHLTPQLYPPIISLRLRLITSGSASTWDILWLHVFVQCEGVANVAAIFVHIMCGFVFVPETILFVSPPLKIVPRTAFYLLTD